MPSTQFQLALLALKGGRFEEAERQLTRLAEASGSAVAWSALFVAKLSLLTSGRTAMDEVRLCADFARGAAEDSDEIRDVEDVVASNTVAYIGNLYDLLADCKSNVENAHQRAFTTMAVAGLATLTGTSSRTAFGALASYDVFSRSLSVATRLPADIVQAGAAVQAVETLINELSSFVRRFSPEPDWRYVKALRLLSMMEERNRTAIEPQRPSLPVASPKGAPRDLRSVPDTWGGDALYSAPGEWHVRIGDQSQIAASFSTLEAWAATRKISRAAMVWNAIFDSWQEASTLEPLRDALGLPPTRGLFVQRCSLCRSLILINVAAVDFVFGRATVICTTCKRKVNVRRKDLAADQRLYKLRIALDSGTSQS